MCRPFQECFGHGLFSAPVRMWKKHRKTIQPLYGKSNLPFYQSEMNRYICKYLKVLKKHVNGPEFDLWNDMPNMIFDIVTKTIFDIELNSKEEAELQFHKCIQVVDEHIFMSSLRPWLHFKFLRDLRYAFYVNKFRQKLYAFAKKIAEDKMPAVIKNLEQNGNSLEDLSSPSLLSTIYEQSKETGSEQLMLDQIVIISVANKLYEEIHQVFGDDNRQADIADLDRLPYLDQVLKESQRRFPAIPLIFRHVEEDTRIGSLTVPAGTAIAINTIGVHFNPQYYPDPYKFDPDRFSPAEESKRPKLSYIPFSAGVRNCIGLNYAVALVKLAAIAILREYSIHSTTKMEDVKLKVEFITTSLYGYNVSIKRRNQQLNCDFVVE